MCFYSITISHPLQMVFSPNYSNSPLAVVSSPAIAVSVFYLSSPATQEKTMKIVASRASSSPVPISPEAKDTAAGGLGVTVSISSSLAPLAPAVSPALSNSHQPAEKSHTASEEEDDEIAGLDVGEEEAQGGNLFSGSGLSPPVVASPLWMAAVSAQLSSPLDVPPAPIASVAASPSPIAAISAFSPPAESYKPTLAASHSSVLPPSPSIDPPALMAAESNPSADEAQAPIRSFPSADSPKK